MAHWTMGIAALTIGTAAARDPLDVLRAAESRGWSASPTRDLDPADHALSWDVRCYASGLRTAVAAIPGDRVAVQTVVDRGTSTDPAGREGAAHLAEHLWFDARPGAGASVGAQLDDLGAWWNAETRPELTVYKTVAPGDALEPLLALEAARLQDPLAGIDEAAVARAAGVLAAERRTAARGAIAAHQTLLRMLYPGVPHLARLSRETDESVARLDRATLAGLATVPPSGVSLIVAGPRPEAELHAAVAGALSPGAAAPCAAPDAPVAAGSQPRAEEQRIFPVADGRRAVLVSWRVPPDADAVHLSRAAAFLEHLLRWQRGEARVRGCFVDRGRGHAELTCWFRQPDGEPATLVAAAAQRTANEAVAAFQRADLDDLDRPMDLDIGDMGTPFHLRMLRRFAQPDSRHAFVVAGATSAGMDPRLPVSWQDTSTFRWTGAMPAPVPADAFVLADIARDLRAWIRPTGAAWVALRPTHDAAAAAEGAGARDALPGEAAPPTGVPAPAFPAGDLATGEGPYGTPILALRRPGAPSVSVALMAGPEPAPDDAAARRAWFQLARSPAPSSLLGFHGATARSRFTDGWAGAEVRAPAVALEAALHAAVAATHPSGQGSATSPRRRTRSTLPAEQPTPTRHFLGREPESSLSGITPRDVEAAHIAVSHPARTRLVIVGDIDPSAAVTAAKAALADRATSTEPAPPPVAMAPWPPPKRELVVLDRDTARAHVQLTCAAPPGATADPDVVQAWLGAAVHADLREARQLVYSPYVREVDLAPLQAWNVSAETEPDSVPAVVAALLDVVTPTASPDPAGVARARNVAMGAWRRQLATRDGWMRLLGGLPPGATPAEAHAARTASITTTDGAAIQAALAACADHAVVTIRGPGEAIAGALDAAGHDVWLFD